MPKYSVVLEGKDFPLVTEEGAMLYGFYTTITVKADNPGDAENAAVEMVKGDIELLDGIDKSAVSDPELFLDSIYKLHWWSRLGGSGYTFYPMDSE